MKKLIYIFDPLCGWCYGFSPVVTRLQEMTRNEAQWDVIPGGMILGDRVGPIGRIAGFLSAAIPRLEATTGVKMGTAFMEGVLEEGSMILSSLEPSRALVAAKIIDPNLAVAFAGALQKSLYEEGLCISDPKVLQDLADRFFLKEFSTVMQDPLSLERTQNEFELAASWGVTGYPTLLGVKDGQGTVFSRGWAAYDTLFPKVQEWLNEKG